jgi:hypothetical protein
MIRPAVLHRWHRIRAGAVAAVLTVASPGVAHAQQLLAPAGVTTRLHPVGVFQSAPAASGASTPLAVQATEHRADRIVRHAALGLLIGAGTVALAVFIHTQIGDYTDHSEDGAFLIYGAAVGGMVGTVAGTVVGIVRTR